VLGWVGELLVAHMEMEIVSLVAWEDVEMIVEGVLTTYWFVVLKEGDPVTLIDTLHDHCNLLGNTHNMSCNALREIIDILVVLVGYYYHVTRIILDPERADKGAN